MSGLTDEQILEIYRSQNKPELIGELFNRYTHLVYGNCLNILEDTEQARDAVMQIFEKLLTTLAESEIRHFSSWLYQVSRNHCLMELRRQKTHRKSTEALKASQMDLFVESAETMHLNDEDGDLAHRKLRNAMASIKGDQRKCLELMYLEGKSYREIAEITGLDWNQVKSHIQNGKRNLRQKLGMLGMIVILILFISLS